MLNLGNCIKLSSGTSFSLRLLVFFLGLYSLQSQVIPKSSDNFFDQRSVSVDSAVNWLEEHIYEKDNHFDSISNQILDRALRDNDYKNIADIHIFKSHWHYLNNTTYHSDSIIFHQVKAIEFYKKDNNLDRVNESYLGLAMDYINNNEQKKAEEVILKAIHYFEGTGNKAWLAESHAQIAALYLSTKEPEKVIQYSELSFAILLEYKEYLQASSVLRYSSDAYRMLKDYKKALEYVDECIELASNNNFRQQKDMLYAAYETKGNIYSDQNLHDEALTYYKKAWLENIEDGKENGDFYRYNIGNTLFKQEKYKEALPHLIAGIKGKEHSKIDRASDLYLTLSKCYEMLGNYERAIAFRDKARGYETELYQEKIDHLKSEMIVKYETEKKDEALAAQEILLTQRNKVKNLVIVVASLLLAFLFLLLYFFRKNKKNTRIISKKNSENELLLKEIHHRVKNNLEMVKGLLALQSAQLEDSVTKDAMIASQNRVQSMGIIHQKLYQGENLGTIEMKDYFINLGEGVLDTFNKDEKIKIECVMEDLNLDIDTAVPIGLIVNELLTNALKYAFPEDKKGNIKINLSRAENNTLSLNFMDDGIGKKANSAPKGTGFGTQLIELLTRQLNGKMEESSELGTSYIFQFKLNTAA